MSRSSGRGRGRGRSTSRAQVAVSNIAHTGSTPPFQPIPFQPSSSSNSTIDCLASAAAMIETDGDPTDTLLEHQTCRPTSLPSQHRLCPYSIPSSRTTSRRTLRTSASIYDIDNDANSTNKTSNMLESSLFSICSWRADGRRPANWSSLLLNVSRKRPSCPAIIHLFSGPQANLSILTAP